MDEVGQFLAAYFSTAFSTQTDPATIFFMKQEWQSLVDEVGQFLAADVGMPLPRSPGLPIPFKLNMR